MLEPDFEPRWVYDQVSVSWAPHEHNIQFYICDIN